MTQAMLDTMLAFPQETEGLGNEALEPTGSSPTGPSTSS